MIADYDKYEDRMTAHDFLWLKACEEEDIVVTDHRLCSAVIVGSGLESSLINLSNVVLDDVKVSRAHHLFVSVTSRENSLHIDGIEDSTICAHQGSALDITVSGYIGIDLTGGGDILIRGKVRYLALDLEGFHGSLILDTEGTTMLAGYHDSWLREPLMMTDRTIITRT